MSQSGILKVEVFDVWRIDFMCPFRPSHNNLYILMAIIIFLSGQKLLPPQLIIPRLLLSSLRGTSLQALGH